MTPQCGLSSAAADTCRLLFDDAIHHLYELAARRPRPVRNRSSLGHDCRERSKVWRFAYLRQMTVRHRSATLRYVSRIGADGPRVARGGVIIDSELINIGP